MKIDANKTTISNYTEIMQKNPGFKEAQAILFY